MNGRLGRKGSGKYLLTGGVFAGVGLGFAFLLPPLMLARPAPDGQTLVGVLRVLGAAFLALGGATLLMVVLVGEIDRATPQNAAVWEWWMEFVGGVLGVAMFGVPASFVLPLMGFLYIDRPNWAFPDAEAAFWPLGYLWALFTALGLLSLTALIHLGRPFYRNRPRWKR